MLTKINVKLYKKCLTIKKESLIFNIFLLNAYIID